MVTSSLTSCGATATAAAAPAACPAGDAAVAVVPFGGSSSGVITMAGPTLSPGPVVPGVAAPGMARFVADVCLATVATGALGIGGSPPSRTTSSVRPAATNAVSAAV